ncbi:hypothetical protein HPDFL43_01575 [Hoeflea phototrophica DFL-43]|uniref:Glycosyl/glycerophosphate transferase n=2 Tax=Hoeflea TaxID=274591 RepID=A9CZU2_HOEPD|nr:hypothetical protein HPDFL43_01575 [Hoeflea phototrophica DFL-43]
MDSRGRPLAFFVGNIGSFRLQRYLLKYCLHQGRKVVVLFNGPENPVFQEIKSEAACLNIECIATEQFSGSWKNLKSFRTTGVPLITRLLSAFPFNRWVNGRWPQVGLSLDSFMLLDSVSPCALVVSEDGVSTSQFVLNAAKRMGIPVVDVPYGNATRQDFDIDIERKVSEGNCITTEGVKGWLLSKFAPQWLKTGKHAGQLMFPQSYILKQELLGISIRDPWIVHGGASDRLCAENSLALQQYLEEGIPREKISLTGSPYSDCMLEGLAEDSQASSAFLKSRYIVSGRPRVLVSWPPSYHSIFPGRNEFSTYEEMTVDILDFVSTLRDCDLTVSVHPAADAKVHELLNGIGISTSADDVIRLLPCNDIFITYFSSSIRWALGAGKVVLNYDAYRIGLDNYSSAPGFWTTAESAQLKTRLAELVANEAEFARLAGAQAADAPNWGFLDGKCNERILAEIDQLMEKHIGGH